jgi:uncharacterized protein (TIGR03032 family)
MRTRYTNEVQNVAFAPTPPGDAEALLRFETSGPWCELLAELDVSLAVSREYEHLLLLLGTDGGRPWQSAMDLPHPSGLFYDERRDELIVSSTRTPNQLFFLKGLGDADYDREIVPADFPRPDGRLYIPYRSVLLPGTLYIHDLVLMGDDIFVTATGHNFLARVLPLGGWQRVWWPACVDALGRASFDQNYLQLNSIACAGSPERSYYTAFSDQPSGPKPWKEGYGPRGKGVVFAGSSRQTICRGLTCPHSAKLRDGRLWLCNSGYGEVGILEMTDETSAGGNRYHAVATVPGFTRGLAFAGHYGFVGLSKVIDFYEPYAPGLDPKASKCGIVAFDTRSLWPAGYQIYDVQVMPGVRRPLLPSKPADDRGINTYLRHLG